MSEAEVVTLNLKVVINKEKTRVLFAEVDNDFVNLLFSFLILPLGNIVQVLEKHYGDNTPQAVGSLNTLYSSLANLCGCPFKSIGFKPAILNKAAGAYAFPNFKELFALFIHSQTSCSLGKAYFVVHKVFTKAKASFIVCNDLRIVPNVKESVVQTLKNVGVDMADMDGSEIRNVTFGLNEVMDFLKGLLISRQSLTDIILGTPVKSELESCKSEIPSHQIDEEATTNSKKMVLKAMLHKSTKKLLFAQAGKEFASFLFTMLRTPLGMGDLLLGGNTFLNNVGSLYKSIADLVDPKYLEKEYTKDHLMKPESFASDYLSAVIDGILDADRSRMYMVTDDLTVTLLHLSSVFSFLNQMKISASDVEEVELHIGLEEARNILKASLTSTRAMSDGLITALEKQQKQEH